MNNEDKLIDELAEMLKAVATLAQHNKHAVISRIPGIAKEIAKLVRDSECEDKENADFIRRSKERLEFAESINRFSDVAFYSELIRHLSGHKAEKATDW